MGLKYFTEFRLTGVALIIVLLSFVISLNASEVQENFDEEEDFGQEGNQLQSVRDPKFFPGLWDFQKKINKGSSKTFCKAGGKYGHCVKRYQCTNSIGSLANSDTIENGYGCALGLGCCILNATCSANFRQRTVRNNLTYLQYRANDPACSTEFKITRPNNVCQLRVEFKSFRTTQPNDQGACLYDSVTFKAENLPTALVLCGNAHEDDHLYLHYGDSNQITINFEIMNLTSSVDILVKHIKCNDENKAPDGCTQYFTEQRGNVRSFNHAVGGQQQLNNQIYAVCVKGDQGAESITWSRCELNSPTDFQIVGPSHPADSPCQTDSVTIPGSPKSIYCQPGSFMQPVKSSAKPFILYVHLNPEEMQTNFGPAPPGNMGCPNGFTWEPPMPSNGNVGFCQPNAVPNPFVTFDDMGNTAFCLRYIRS